MKHYLDITLLPSDDIGVNFLWSKVMMQVHLALVEIQDGNKKVPVAISFPQYRAKLGAKSAFLGHKLRLLAQDENDFEKLNITKWLNRLDDYVHIKSVAAVPNDISNYESYSKPTKLGSPQGYIKRRMKRKGESEEQASAHFASYQMDPNVKTLPFIKLKSLGSDQTFNMVIKQRNIEKIEETFLFNTYGINSKATLPKF
jgi:CRISPR-associated endonuclease Csy4